MLASDLTLAVGSRRTTLPSEPNGRLLGILQVSTQTGNFLHAGIMVVGGRGQREPRDSVTYYGGVAPQCHRHRRPVQHLIGVDCRRSRPPRVPPPHPSLSTAGALLFAARPGAGVSFGLFHQGGCEATAYIITIISYRTGCHSF